MAAASRPITYPYQKVVAISTSDTVSIASGPTDAVLCLTAGTAQMADAAGSAVLGVPMTAGQIFPIRIVRINTTSTTGTYAALYYI